MADDLKVAGGPVIAMMAAIVALLILLFA